MTKIVLALIVVTVLATGIAYSISRKSSTSTIITDASPLKTYARQGKGIRERISAPRKDSGLLGDHRAGTLLGKYIPDYNDNSNAGIVQQYTTEYLRQLGNNAQLLGVPPPGPDPRPNLEQWNDLEKLQQAGTSERVDVYSVRP